MKNQQKQWLPTIFFCYILSIYQETTIAAFTLRPSQFITDGQTLVSLNAKFELGFFSPVGSKKRYIGIWYKPIPVQTVVWVANRDSPLHDTSGVLKISNTGNLVIVNQTGSAIWSSNLSKAVEIPIVEFLESGNLVLRDVKNGDPESYLWQSFDYPGDTLLPGMKLGWDLQTGLNRQLLSWKNPDDPSPGEYTYGMYLTSYLELGIRHGSKLYLSSGPWNGRAFSGAPYVTPAPLFTHNVTHNAKENYYMYQLYNQSVIVRLVLTQGYVERYIWVDKSINWKLLVKFPLDRCDYYMECGANSICDMKNIEQCQCLKGFKPKSPEAWNTTDCSEGCVREVSLNCTKGEGFIKYAGVRLPETTGSWVNTSMNLEDCRVKCLESCSCVAYSNSDIRGSGSGCIMWFRNLTNTRQMNVAGQDLYIRTAASELGSEAKSRVEKLVILIVSIAFVAGVIMLGLGSWCIWKKKSPKGDSERDDLELPLYELFAITRATDNFSAENKLGEGGFGPVYKGELKGGQEIAVKRLSKDSIQGVNEFKNEVILISKLQHRNLVRLLGCCIDGEEKMLVYEYMQNKSLDSFIFDETKRTLLDWQTRFQIIIGIARGLLYLHQDSRLRIIHRDLKASNILLDTEMIPRISDFGMARIFRRDQIDAETERVAGTYGYMSPEYVVDGFFSEKSDVFSFGVLVLEIISGKKNRGFYHPDHQLNLLGHAWRLWCEEKSMEFLDELISKSCFVEEFSRCVHIGLLCVQKGTEERPDMSSVVLMLSSETAVLPKPQPPGFYIERSTPMKEISSCSDKESFISNEATITLLEGR